MPACLERPNWSCQLLPKGCHSQVAALQTCSLAHVSHVWNGGWATFKKQLAYLVSITYACLDLPSSRFRVKVNEVPPLTRCRAVLQNPVKNKPCLISQVTAQASITGSCEHQWPTLDHNQSPSGKSHHYSSINLWSHPLTLPSTLTWSNLHVVAESCCQAASGKLNFMCPGTQMPGLVPTDDIRAGGS